MNKNQIGDMEHAIKNKRFYTDANDNTKQAGWDERSAYYIPTSEGKAELKKLTQ